MKIVLTGAHGFLGWHTRVRLHALTDHEVVPVGRDDFDELPDLFQNVDAVIHIAGINRAAEDEVEDGNRRLAEQVGQAIVAAGRAPRIIFANSTQAGNGTPYGTGKQAASKVLAAVAEEVGAHFVDVQLPNIFGEHGRPYYNSFVATFVDSVIKAVPPHITDREVELLHVQSAAQCLIDALMTAESQLAPAGELTTVQDVYEKLQSFRQTYESGDIPPLLSQFDVDLFNTLRAAMFPDHYPIALTTHADDRGRLVETVRAHGGQGQTFVSTTRPGVTRGDHFHLGKVERFVVLSGKARISLRKVLTEDAVSFDVNGDQPVIVDMPTMWVHNITNTGDTEVVTLFWTHTLFDPGDPDTYWEPVAIDAKASA